MKSSSTSATKVIRVLIADDHPVVREGLVTILKSEKDIEVVAEAADGKETCELKAQFFENDHENDFQTSDSGLKAGAKGYLVKGADPGSRSKSCRRTSFASA
jgi:hypothetical protein